MKEIYKVFCKVAIDNYIGELREKGHTNKYIRKKLEDKNVNMFFNIEDLLK